MKSKRLFIISISIILLFASSASLISCDNKYDDIKGIAYVNPNDYYNVISLRFDFMPNFVYTNNIYASNIYGTNIPNEDISKAINILKNNHYSSWICMENDLSNYNIEDLSSEYICVLTNGEWLIFDQASSRHWKTACNKLYELLNKYIVSYDDVYAFPNNIFSALSIDITPDKIEDMQGNTIQFRNIPWLEKYQIVKEKIESINGIKKSLNPVEEDTTISDALNDIYVDNGGVELNYYNVSVAGYDASLNIYFIYAIENGKTIRDINEAKLFKARYVLYNSEDPDGTYDDIVSKLTVLYGQPEEVQNEYTPFFMEYNGLMWLADDGSCVVISMNKHLLIKNDNTIEITYSAPNTTTLLEELDDQLQKEKMTQYEEEREKNANNYNGL